MDLPRSSPGKRLRWLDSLAPICVDGHGDVHVALREHVHALHEHAPVHCACAGGAFIESQDGAGEGPKGNGPSGWRQSTAPLSLANWCARRR